MNQDKGRLILNIRLGEGIFIDDEIYIKIKDVSSGRDKSKTRVRLCIEAPKTHNIIREELLKKLGT